MTQIDLPVLVDGDLCLRPPHRTDVEGRLALGNTPEIQHMFGVPRNACKPITKQSAEAWVNLQMSTPTLWIIEHEGRLIGNAFLHSVNADDRRASLALGILDPELLGRGFGSRVLRLLLDHAFGAMALHRVALRVLEYNSRAIAAYKKVGFLIEGCERESALVGDDWFDDLIMGLLASDFRKLHI